MVNTIIKTKQEGKKSYNGLKASDRLQLATGMNAATEP